VPKEGGDPLVLFASQGNTREGEGSLAARKIHKSRKNRGCLGGGKSAHIVKMDGGIKVQIRKKARKALFF